MAEEYAGVKFKTVFEGVDFGCAKEREAIMGQLAWMNKSQLLHGIPGNVSLRTEGGIVITPTGKDLAKVAASDMVIVKGINEKARLVRVIGSMLPSSEAMMHWLIYQKFKKVNVIVHFHDDGLLQNHKKFIETEDEHPYGTLGLAHAAIKALEKKPFVILKNHGGLAVGKDFKACNALIEKALKAIK